MDFIPNEHTRTGARLRAATHARPPTPHARLLTAVTIANEYPCHRFTDAKSFPESDPKKLRIPSKRRLQAMTTIYEYGPFASRQTLSHGAEPVALRRRAVARHETAGQPSSATLPSAVRKNARHMRNRSSDAVAMRGGIADNRSVAPDESGLRRRTICKAHHTIGQARKSRCCPRTTEVARGLCEVDATDGSTESFSIASENSQRGNHAEDIFQASEHWRGARFDLGAAALACARAQDIAGEHGTRDSGNCRHYANCTRQRRDWRSIGRGRWRNGRCR